MRSGTFINQTLIVSSNKSIPSLTHFSVLVDLAPNFEKPGENFGPWARANAPMIQISIQSSDVGEILVIRLILYIRRVSIPCVATR